MSLSLVIYYLVYIIYFLLYNFYLFITIIFNFNSFVVYSYVTFPLLLNLLMLKTFLYVSIFYIISVLQIII